MKNRIVKAGLCVFAAGLLFSSTVYGAAQARDYDDNASINASEYTATAFWKRKDKEQAPENSMPSPSPEPSAAPTGVPKDAPKLTPQPQATPQVSPQAVPQAPKESDKESNKEELEKKDIEQKDIDKKEMDKEVEKKDDEKKEDNEAAMARYYNNNNQGQQQYQHNQQRQNSNNNNQNQNQSQNQKRSSYTADSAVEITRILSTQPTMHIEPGAYIVQHDDGLWLVMGNIRAKLDILIYVDQKNDRNAELIIHGNAIPLYK